MSRRSRRFLQDPTRYVKDFFTNMDQPGMLAAEKWSKFARNRFRATVLMKGCCGNDGEPGC